MKNLCYQGSARRELSNCVAVVSKVCFRLNSRMLNDAYELSLFSCGIHTSGTAERIRGTVGGGGGRGSFSPHFFQI